MKFSENWLRKFINISGDSKFLCKQLNMLGIEVNNIESISSRFFKNVVVGEIFNFEYLSDLDNLYVFKVHIGNSNFLNIINKNFCFKIGMKIAIATVKSILPHGLFVKKNLFGNLLSDGIMCSYHLLGIEHNNLNIVVLPDYIKVGDDLSNYFDFDDKIIDISINYNRYDCYNMLGLARELSVFNFDSVKLPESSFKININYNYFLPITISDNRLCPIYLGRVIKNVNINSIIPIWMSERLRRSDIKLVNSVVDIINYVFLEFGLFVNVFDVDLINNGINIRLSKSNEKIMLIDDSLIELNSNDVLIVEDDDNIIEIAGIINSKYSVLNENTKNLFLECAFFLPDIISNFIVKYGIKVNFTRVYFQDTNYSMYVKVMERVTYFILRICGGEVGPIINMSNLEFLPNKSCIFFSYKRLNSFIGHNISYDFVIKILKFIGCKLDLDNNNFNVIPPSWRYDLIDEKDLIEEIVRFYGYDNIPIVPIKSNYVSKVFDLNLSIDRAKNLLIDKGYQEVITYSFVNNDFQSLLHPNINSLSVLNPISLEKSVMRVSLLSGLLATLRYNHNHQQNNLSIFEFGICFIPKFQVEFIVEEILVLSALLSGNKYVECWDILSENVDFYDLKGVLESILGLFYNLNLVSFKSKKYSFFHPGKSAAIYYKDIYIGYIGVIHPSILKYLLFDYPVILFELYWDKMIPVDMHSIKKLSVYPMNRRDISLIVSDDIYSIDIINACRKFIGELLVNIYIFDVYFGNDIAKGYKSISIAIFLQSLEKTLNDYEISIVINKCIDMLQDKFKIKLRS